MHADHRPPLFQLMKPGAGASISESIDTTSSRPKARANRARGELLEMMRALIIGLPFESGARGASYFLFQLPQQYSNIILEYFLYRVFVSQIIICRDSEF